MNKNSKTLWIVLLAAILVAVVCVTTVILVRNDNRQGILHTTTISASSSTDESQKIREAIAEDFFKTINDAQPEDESNYEPLTLPPEGETFSFAFNN